MSCWAGASSRNGTPTFNGDATTLCRRDAEGALRQVRLGLESFRTVQCWLEDFYRGRFLLRCNRLVRKLHRTHETTTLLLASTLMPLLLAFGSSFRATALHFTPLRALTHDELLSCQVGLLGSLMLPLPLNFKGIAANVFAVKLYLVVPTSCGSALVPRTSGFTWSRRNIAARNVSCPGWPHQGLIMRDFVMISVRLSAMRFGTNLRLC